MARFLLRPKCCAQSGVHRKRRYRWRKALAAYPIHVDAALRMSGSRQAQVRDSNPISCVAEHSVGGTSTRFC